MCFHCFSAVLKAVGNVNNVIAPALVGKVCIVVVIVKNTALKILLSNIFVYLRATE